MAEVLTMVVVCLVVSFIFSEIAQHFRYPPVIGQILAGVFLGIPLFKGLFSQEAIIDINFLSELGIIFLLLLTGLELNLEKFKKSEKDSVVIAVLSAIIPFALGFLVMIFLGYSKLIAVVLGACLSLTSEGTKLKALIDMKLLNTRVGVIMLTAGILDDIFEVLFLSFVIILASNQYGLLYMFPIKLILFVLIVYITYKIFPFILKHVRREHSRVSTFSTLLIFGLIIALLSKHLDLGPIIGAFIAGIIIHLSERQKKEYRQHINELSILTFSFIVPFFFINIGLQFSINSLMSNLSLVVLVLIVAILGKIGGSLLSTPFTSLTYKQTHLIGWGMNSRGAVELVIAEIARKAGIIPIEVYSAVVIMAITTTIIFPVALKIIVSREPDIMK